MAVAVPGKLIDPIADIRGILASHYCRLSDTSRSLRFMCPTTDDALTRIADRASPDLVLAIRADGDIRGILELFDLQNGHAEVGLSVEDAYQGRGYGRALFHAGIDHARLMKLDTVDLYFSPSNQAIHKLCTDHDATIDRLGTDSLAHIKL